MSFQETRFTLMAFPQEVNATGELFINIVFIPRNFNPLEKVNTKFNASNKANPFVEAVPKFVVRVVNHPDKFPGKKPLPPDEKSYQPLTPLAFDSNKLIDIYTTLRDTKNHKGDPAYFDIDPNRSADTPVTVDNAEHRAPKAEANRNSAIRKYLPQTYRKAFNFTSPRITNAVTDDSYHCALRESAAPGNIAIDHKVSWGQVYAHLLRQPIMAEQAGLIYKTKIKLEAGDFEKGGWIYIDIDDDHVYKPEQLASVADPEGPFIKSYAARIPQLKENEARQLFAPVLFPVVLNGIDPQGNFDEIFIEAARFNEGFATIAHANQAISGNLLEEEHDGLHPQKESGIRLGWEDEQILIWYLRQLAIDENTGDRIDSPLGIMGYHVDVKLSNPEPGEDPNWQSLNSVISNGNMQLMRNEPFAPIDFGSFQGEIPYQVYPSKIYNKNTDTNNFWLPMYFANWNDASLVLPDKTASDIHHNNEDDKFAVTSSETYSNAILEASRVKLRYENKYEFRVRLADITGGGPSTTDPSPSHLNSSHIAKTSFKRYVAPHALTLINEDEVDSKNDGYSFSGDKLSFSRPLLGYPAVVYTGKYSDPITKLKNAAKALLKVQELDWAKPKEEQKGGKAFGIPDPDVVAIHIKVEVESLKMDNLISYTGRENYIPLYETKRFFPAFDENDASHIIDIPLIYKDINVLQLEDVLITKKPFLDDADNECLKEDATDLILPTSRNIRITFRAVGKNNANYWGYVNTADESLSSHFGKTTVLTMREESKSINTIFKAPEAQTLQAIYLQPDPSEIELPALANNKLHGQQTNSLPNIVQRLSGQLDVEAKELTLTARNGEQVQFWCSNLIRHSMAPDNSSITFANKHELQNHWLVCTTLYIDRDWTWDGLEPISFDIERKMRFSSNPKSITEIDYETNIARNLELKRTASFQAIQEGKDKRVRRDYTKIILIDAVDAKPGMDQLGVEKFPETIEVQYKVVSRLKNLAAADYPLFETEHLRLPTTILPAQMPKLITAGIALSPYNRNQTYSATEARTRYLWLEFDKAPYDENDDLFCRVLAYSADQLLSHNHPSLMMNVTEPPLNLDPEYIRLITPESAEDHRGLDAMQKMEKSVDKDRHYYLLPLPPGLHRESPELFGMFTYEFRYGHSNRIWSTAQARFGRPLRVAGIQHPAPTLFCMVSRDEKIISVNAPYASAVFDGKDVTASPPHTSMWALLYAQVKQADGLDYRNILLNEIELKPLKKRQREELHQDTIKYYEAQNVILKKKKLPTVEINNELLQQQVFQQIAWEKESKKQAFAQWTNKEVEEMLDLYGLPTDSSLSIICVEVFGHITNAFEHIDDFSRNKNGLIQQTARVFGQDVAQGLRREWDVVNEPQERAKQMDPLNSQLGGYRILRTSPLTEVPFICCTE